MTRAMTTRYHGAIPRQQDAQAHARSKGDHGQEEEDNEQYAGKTEVHIPEYTDTRKPSSSPEPHTASHHTSRNSTQSYNEKGILTIQTRLTNHTRTTTKPTPNPPSQALSPQQHPAHSPSLSPTPQPTPHHPPATLFPPHHFPPPAPSPST